jgi:hypothetical protein
VGVTEGGAVALHEGLDVPVGPAGNDGEAAGGDHASHGSDRLASELLRRELGVRRQNAEEVVGHPGHLVVGDLVGDDGGAVVHLNLVSVYHLMKGLPKSVLTPQSWMVKWTTNFFIMKKRHATLMSILEKSKRLSPRR